MTIEKFVIDALQGILPDPVSGERPSPMPARFFTVEKTDSADKEHISKATLIAESWAESQAAAAEQNRLMKAAMESLAALPEISAVTCETDCNYPDLTTRRPRYRATFAVVHYL